MKIAFDVQGTLQGYHSDKVMNLFKILQDRGHELYIWSFGGYGMAVRAATELGIEAKYCAKQTHNYDEESTFVDVCVDDDRSSAEILSAGKVIYVNEIPNPSDKDKVEALLKVYGF